MDEEGNGIDSQENTVHVSDLDFSFDETAVSQGLGGISAPYHGSSGWLQVTFQHPVMRDGKPIGDVYADRNINDYNLPNLFSFHNGEGSAYVVDSQGNFIIKTRGTSSEANIYSYREKPELVFDEGGMAKEDTARNGFLKGMLKEQITRESPVGAGPNQVRRWIEIHLIPAEDVLEFDEKGYIYDLSDLKCIRNLSKDALIQSTYDGKVFSLPLSYTCFGFVWNVDMLKQYDLAVPENREEFLNVCETLKENGILPYGANKDFGLTVPVMCAGLYDVYQGEGTEQKLQELSEGTTPVSEYMRKGFDFLQMMIDKGYMDPEKALDTIPSSDGEKEFFAQENCAFICAIYRGKTFEGYPFEIEMTPLPLLEKF